MIGEMRMKRLLLGALLCIAPVKAESLDEVWRDLSKYRIASFVKAVVTTGLIYHSGVAMQVHFDETYTAVGDKDVQKAYQEGIPTAGLLYVMWKLSWDGLRPQLKHALAIK